MRVIYKRNLAQLREWINNVNDQYRWQNGRYFPSDVRVATILSDGTVSDDEKQGGGLGVLQTSMRQLHQNQSDADLLPFQVQVFDEYIPAGSAAQERWFFPEELPGALDV